VRFTAVGFDLDGTLYPNYRLFIRLFPFFVRGQRLLRAMDKVRTYLRKSGAYEPAAEAPGAASTMRGSPPGGDFYELQARLMGEILHESPEKVRERTERLIYRGWEPHFKNIKLFPHVRETLEAFRKKGIRMGLLSDFPPEIKLENLKLTGYWDAMVCSEESGRLKPDPVSFLDLARQMKREPEEILYVGNSISYDVVGAGRAGMKTALICSPWKRRSASSGGGGRVVPDFVFKDYRQLHDYVLH